ncbi:uncharacterized protein CEXT_556941 [Caerostris extrusa]|uniref:Uncharacterized protein n=1 Tax=Caerostris extrusa TaxID=172846 RepID=A0AAV4NRU1_CAEEX|nr:uncharacterized protein CEXT_556941 [Caerostris extrusa]
MPRYILFAPQEEKKSLPLPVTAKTHYASVATVVKLIHRNAMGFRTSPGGESYSMLLCNIPLGFPKTGSKIFSYMASRKEKMEVGKRKKRGGGGG